MYRDLERLSLILQKINSIEENIKKAKNITEALSDDDTFKPAILMHLIAIAEQFSKIKDENILKKFNKSDIKGSINIRNFIAHDYEGINLLIIELIIREKLPILKRAIKATLEKYKDIKN